MLEPVCAMCTFPNTDNLDSYALVLLAGRDGPAALLEEAEAASRKAAVPCMSAYCSRCARVTWLAREKSLSESLLDFCRRLREFRALTGAVAQTK